MAFSLKARPDPARFYVGLLSGAIAMWIVPLVSSFRLDEITTAWVSSESLGRSLADAGTLQQEGPLYFALMWLVRHTIGGSEPAMRLPSFAATLLCVFLAYRVGRRLIDNETGLIAAAVLALCPGILFVAADARPYALAMCCAVGSTLCLLRGTDERKPAFMLAWGALAALAIHFQEIVALSLLAHVVLLARRRPSLRLALPGPALALALVAPLIPHLIEVARRQSDLVVTLPVTPGGLVRNTVPAVVIWGLLAGVALSVVVTRPHLNDDHPGRGAFEFAMVWASISPLFLFGISRLTSVVLFDPRYFFSALPGIALALAIGLRRLSPDVPRRAALAGAAVIALFATSSTTHSGEDWRGALLAARRLTAGRQAVTLVETGFIETRSGAWFSNDARRRYGVGPAIVYPLPGKLIPAPWEVAPKNAAYLEQLRSEAVGRERLVLVYRFPLTAVRDWLDTHMTCATSRTEQRFQLVSLILYDVSKCNVTP